MTLADELVEDLLREPLLFNDKWINENLIHQFKNKMVTLLASLKILKATMKKTNKVPIDIRSCILKTSSDLEEAMSIYQKIHKSRPSTYSFSLERQGFSTAFEEFDQKADQLFNIISTSIKNENEVRQAIIKNII
jgi:hypothetical protein